MVNTRTADILISATGLAAGYDKKILWQDATFAIRRGEFTGLLGPNGAGKTTLFRMLLGLNRPIQGTLRVLGHEPRRGDQHIGLYGTRWGMGTLSNAQHERVVAFQALEAVDASGLAHQPLGQLSGGELQRIFLAQALVGKPDLLLLDEPLANLDIRRETELIQLISNAVKRENIAVLLIAHDINPLLPVIDGIIYIANGKVATGKVNDIVTTDGLSKLYGAPVEVLRDSRGRIAVLGTEEAAHHA
jgi:zinc/manganese transport system ATP-binding protein